MDKREAYVSLIETAKEKGATRFSPIIPNSGSNKKAFEIPEGKNAVGIEAWYPEGSKKIATYALYEGGESKYVADLFNW